jgi:hypothetical protein
LSDGGPSFVNYVNTREFGTGSVGPDSGPEIVRFVPVEDSPVRAPLLVVSHEITGTVVMFALNVD